MSEHSSKTRKRNEANPYSPAQFTYLTNQIHCTVLPTLNKQIYVNKYDEQLNYSGRKKDVTYTHVVLISKFDDRINYIFISER